MINYLSNTLKALFLLTVAGLLMVCFIFLPPFISNFYLKDFPLRNVINDLNDLLLPLLVGILFSAPVLGLVVTYSKQKRLLKLIATLLVLTYFVVLLTMMFFAKDIALIDDWGAFLMLSIYMFIAYSFFTLPLIVLISIILNKWVK
ncbi:MAG: hypothetical protein Kow0079_16160 [Vicingaceae bacterium]